MANKTGTNNGEYISATDFDDSVWGLGGNDTIDGFNGNDRLDGGDGDDWVYGGRGEDQLWGGNGNDHLYGQEGNDWIWGAWLGQGDDYIDGGDGYDTVDYSGAASPVVVNLSSGKAPGGDIGHDTVYGVENVVGSEGNDIIKGWENNIFGRVGDDFLNGRGGDDFLNGRGDDDFLNGLSGNDTLLGGNGNDTLVGGFGNDYLDGGAGIDTAGYQFETEGVLISTGFSGAQGYDTFVHVENITGSSFDDFIEGDRLGVATNNVLFGGAGNDFLDGDDETTVIGTSRGGNDTLGGGNGHDWLRGGLGNDILTGGAGADTFEFESSIRASEPGTEMSSPTSSKARTTSNSISRGNS
jgi:Ca2+-binding RTX toxin-like protein